jgi:hypothetical protein
VLPIVESNYSGISEVLAKLDATLKTKDAERKGFKEKHGIMTQEERDAAMKRQVREAETQAAAGKAAAAKAGN